MNKLVWYVAAGNELPSGIEDHLLRDATEIRNYGFAPRNSVLNRCQTHRSASLQSSGSRLFRRGVV